MMKKLYNSLEISVIKLTEEVVRTSTRPTIDENGFFDGKAEDLWSTKGN